MVDNSYSIMPENVNNNLVVLCYGLTVDLNAKNYKLEKRLRINFTTSKTKVCLHWHSDGNDSYLHVIIKHKFVNLRALEKEKEKEKKSIQTKSLKRSF